MQISDLTTKIIDEIFAAFGFQAHSWARKTLWPIFWLPAQHFAWLAVGVEQTAAESGLTEAARRLLPRFVSSVQMRGVKNIPPDGPLLVASNHPGAYDSVAILANLPRPDLKVVVSDVPLLRSLPALDRCFIYTVSGVHGRMLALRQMIQHLKRGGAVLIFASGLVDPDPDLLPGAEDRLADWSPSLELALRRVPAARVVPTIVSGVLSPASMNSPLLRFQKEPWRKRKLAEFLQVIQQLVFHRDYRLTPRISFGEPLTGQQLEQRNPAGQIMPELIAQARKLLGHHMLAAPHTGFDTTENVLY